MAICLQELSKKLCFFVKKLVFATKGLKEEAFLDYFAIKSHIYVKKVVFCNKGAKEEAFLDYLA